MTQVPAPSSATASGLVRVTVTSGSRRVDLVLPGAIPVAELVPELARSVGLLDGGTVYGGYRVVLAEGRELAGDLGLISQGVQDGGVLMVTAGIDESTPRVYDDVVEAMTDVVEEDLTPWSPAAGRRTALVAAGALLVLGAVSLWVQGPGALAGTTALVIALVLSGGAVVLSRTERETEAAVGVGWMAQLYAAVGGLLLGLHQFDGPALALPLALCGGAVIVAGLLALLGLRDGRMLVLPGVIVGVIVAATGLLVEAAGWNPAIVLTVVLGVVTLFGSLFPWLALSMTSTDVDRLYSPADITADPRDVAEEKVATDARTAHEILIAISATVGLLLVLVAPLAVALGWSGAALVTAASCVVMLRTRQYRTGSEVLVGLVSGVAGIGMVGVSLLLFYPDWRPTVAVALAAIGGILLALTMLPGNPSVRRGRLADLAETIGLVSLLPLLVIATGLFSSVSI